MIAGVDLSVTTTGKVTCLSISKMDIVKVLPEETLKAMTGTDAEGLLGFSMTEIQQNYLEKIQSRGFKSDRVEKNGSINRK